MPLWSLDLPLPLQKSHITTYGHVTNLRVSLTVRSLPSRLLAHPDIGLAVIDLVIVNCEY